MSLVEALARHERDCEWQVLERSVVHALRCTPPSWETVGYAAACSMAVLEAAGPVTKPDAFLVHAATWGCWDVFQALLPRSAVSTATLLFAACGDVPAAISTAKAVEVLRARTRMTAALLDGVTDMGAVLEARSPHQGLSLAAAAARCGMAQVLLQVQRRVASDQVFAQWLVCSPTPLDTATAAANADMLAWLLASYGWPDQCIADAIAAAPVTAVPCVRQLVAALPPHGVDRTGAARTVLGWPQWHQSIAEALVGDGTAAAAGLEGAAAGTADAVAFILRTFPHLATVELAARVAAWGSGAAALETVLEAVPSGAGAAMHAAARARRLDNVSVAAAMGVAVPVLDADCDWHPLAIALEQGLAAAACRIDEHPLKLCWSEVVGKECTHVEVAAAVGNVAALRRMLADERICDGRDERLGPALRACFGHACVQGDCDAVTTVLDRARRWALLPAIRDDCCTASHSARCGSFACRRALQRARCRVSKCAAGAAQPVVVLGLVPHIATMSTLQLPACRARVETATVVLHAGGAGGVITTSANALGDEAADTLVRTVRALCWATLDQAYADDDFPCTVVRRPSAGAGSPVGVVVRTALVVACQVGRAYAHALAAAFDAACVFGHCLSAVTVQDCLASLLVEYHGWEQRGGGLVAPRQGCWVVAVLASSDVDAFSTTLQSTGVDAAGFVVHDLPQA